MKIKRKIYSGKYYNVVYNDKGKRISWRKWSPTKFTKYDALKKFKKDNTLKKNLSLFELTNVTEYTDTQQRRKVPKKIKKYQIKASVMIGKSLISASSTQFDRNTGIKKVTNNAYENLCYKVAKESGYEYDNEIGNQIILSKGLKVRYELIYYHPRKK